MKFDIEIPFYSNTPDDTHCFQACFKMISGFFWPNKEFSWEELEKITAKKEGLWTWPSAGVLWMQEQGVEVIDMEVFDWSEFVESGEEYLKNFFGKEVGQEQIKHSDIAQEQRLAKEVLKKVKIEKKIPTIQDLKDLVKDCYLVICNVNSQALNDKDGYVGHAVVVKGYTKNGVILHDPGLPAFENRYVSNEQFEKAWAYPNENAKGLMGFKHRECYE